MKKQFYFLLLLFVSTGLISQNTQQASAGWSVSRDDLKVFIENKGQFSLPDKQNTSNIVEYAFDGGGEDFLFTKKGVVFSFLKTEKKTRTVEEKVERYNRKNEGFNTLADWQEFEKIGHKLIETRDVVNAEWIGANPNVSIIADEKNSFYHSYTFVNGKGVEENANQIKSYKKLTYKNLYPNIDVVYEFTGECGIKYSLIVRPGGDLSKVQLRYSKPAVLNNAGEIVINTALGEMIEHAPVTFYAGNQNQSVYSKFFLQNNTVSFIVAGYDKTKTLVVDPWVQTPNFVSTGWDCVWECERDAAGNVYIIGGTSPLQLLKYNAAGALQWTYNTPYDTTEWLGTFAVDYVGNSYVTNGSLAKIFKVNTAAALQWNNASPGGLFGSTEFWNIAFNCDQTRLVIGGTGGTLPPLPYIYNINMNTGNVINSVQVHAGALFPTQEVRTVTACENSKYYFLTHDSIGYIHQSLNTCLGGGGGSSGFPFHVTNGFSLGYKCENWRYNNTGIMALAFYNGFVYVHRGNQLQKRDFATGAVVGTVAIPNGTFTTTFGSNQVGCSGIDIDSCGNIFVGSINNVYKFNTNLQQTGSFATSSNFNIYDVEVSANGDIIACGSTGTSSSGARTGYIQSWAGGACAIKPLVCCDATVCPIPPQCIQGSTVTLTTTSTGGTWSGPGVNSSGVFNPATAGVGTHTVTYTLPCGSESINIVVNNCSALSVCDNNGTYQVSGGTGPYTWYEYNPGGTTPITNQAQCVACGGSWLLNQCFNPFPIAVTSCNTPAGWVQVGTGVTHTPGQTYPMQVVDNAGTVFSIPNAASVQSCSGCTLVASATSTAASCGNNNGSATANPSGGTASTYLWSNGANTQTASNLAAGSYQVTVSGGGCSATASVTVASNGTPLTLNTTSTAAGCTSTGSATVNVTAGTAPFTYAWNNGATTPSINAAAGSYQVTVTGTGGCTASATATIANNGSTVTLNTTSTAAGCTTNGSATVNVTAGTGPYTYSWSNGATTAFINAAAGNYQVTVTGAGGCSASATATIGSSGSAITLATSATGAGCGTSNGTASVNVTAGNGPFTYAWSNSGTSTSISNLPAGNYTVTVTGSGGCSATASVSVTGGTPLNLVTSTQQSSCTGNTGSAIVNVITGTGPYTYNWSTGATTQSITSMGQGTYTVTVTGSGNCSASTTVVITAANGVTLSLVSTHTTCGNNNGSASASTSSGTAPFTFSWSNGATSATINNLPAGSYNVTVTDANNCTATASAVVNPSGGTGVTISSDKPIFCAGDSAKICGPTGYSSYSWNTGATTPCIYVKNAGNYKVTVTDNGGCTAVSNSITQNVHPVPSVGITVKGDTLTSSTALNYQWYRNGSPIPGATSQQYIVTQSGYYQVQITDGNGCKNISEPVELSVTGIENLQDSKVIVYPNPLSEGYWSLQVTAQWIGADVEIFDAAGKLVYISTIKTLQTQVLFEAAQGVYTLRVHKQKNDVAIKLIKL